MELKIAGTGEWKPLVLGGSAGVHSDILNGRDCEVAWEDVFKGKPSSPTSRLVNKLKDFFRFFYIMLTTTQ